MFKCPDCTDKFKIIEDLYEHIEEDHENSIPSDYTVPQYYYYKKTGKVHGNCVVCKKPTEWNTATNKYHRFCKNPKCKETYREEFKKRMIGKYGKVHLLNDPNQQKKMLANRKISGTYIWSDGTEFTYTGSYELDFLRFLDRVMGFESSDILFPSPHVYTYTYEGEEKFYMPDGFIISLGTEIEIKESDNTHPKIQAVDKVKEKLKDEVMMSQKSFNYIKLVDKNNIDFLKFLDRLKDEFEKNPKKPRLVFQVNDKIKYAEAVAESVVTESSTIDTFKEISNMNNPKENKCPVFVVLTYTGSMMAKAIRGVTQEAYSHASISFDSSMKKMYSFGQRLGGFVQESFDKGYFKQVEDRCTYSVYVTFVTEKQKEAMQKFADSIAAMKDKFKFNMVGLFTLMRGKESHRKNEYFCSQFVADVLDKGTDIIKRDPSLYAPMDLVRNKAFKFVCKGTIKNYDKNKVDNIIKEKYNR